MSLTPQREKACSILLYHQSARLIKSDSLFAVVVTGTAWSGEIIFLHALLTLFLFCSFTRPHFLFVSVFLFLNRLILSSPVPPFHLWHSLSFILSLCVCRLCESRSSSFDLTTFIFPSFFPPRIALHSPILEGFTVLRPSESVYSCVAYCIPNTLVKCALEGCFTHSLIPRSIG